MDLCPLGFPFRCLGVVQHLHHIDSQWDSQWAEGVLCKACTVQLSYSCCINALLCAVEKKKGGGGTFYFTTSSSISLSSTSWNLPMQLDLVSVCVPGLSQASLSSSLSPSLCLSTAPWHSTPLFAALPSSSLHSNWTIMQPVWSTTTTLHDKCNNNGAPRR